MSFFQEIEPTDPIDAPEDEIFRTSRDEVPAPIEETSEIQVTETNHEAVDVVADVPPEESEEEEQQHQPASSSRLMCVYFAYFWYLFWV